MSSPEPKCPLCGGLGFLRRDVPVGHPDFGRLVPCSCRLQELESQRLQELQSVGNLDNLDRFTFDRFVPEGHALNVETQRNLRHAYELAKDFAHNPKGWLILVGGYGCGKTHLAAAIANERVEQGQPALFINVPDLLDYLRAAFSPTSQVGYDERFEKVRTASLLILDDLGTENATPWAGEKLYQILNYRYSAQLPTVITTNHQLEEIDVRLRSRMNDQDMCQIYAILAPDYRGSGGAMDPVALSTLDLHSEQTFTTFLDRDDLPHKERNNLSRALATAQSYADEPEGWLFMTGGHGAGKTHLAAAIANYRVSQRYPALFVTVPDLLDYLRAAFSPNSPVSYGKRFSQVRTADLLILDDLGTHSATAWAKEKLYQLFNYRFAARLPTVITSNLSLEEMEKQDPRLFSHLINPTRCTVFAFIVPPFRGKGVPFHPHRRGRR